MLQLCTAVGCSRLWKVGGPQPPLWPGITGICGLSLGYSSLLVFVCTLGDFGDFVLTTKTEFCLGLRPRQRPFTIYATTHIQQPPPLTQTFAACLHMEVYRTLRCKARRTHSHMYVSELTSLRQRLIEPTEYRR